MTTRRKGVVDATPAPGTLFGQALLRFEEAVLDLTRHPPLANARERYENSRQAIVDYVGALEQNR